MPHLVILGCLQVTADQFKVQAIFLLQSGMELCFLQKKKKKNRDRKEFSAGDVDTVL